MSIDIERLRKVRGLMEAGATKGERDAARSRATAMAKAAGLTLKEALSKLDATEKPRPKGLFQGFDDWMEAREPGHKAREAVKRAERERARRSRCEELLREYGSEEAVFAETDQERRLREALQPLATFRKYDGEVDSEGNWRETDKTYIDGFADWRSGPPKGAVLAAIHAAYPLPETVSGAWAEHQQFEAADSARFAFFPEYDPPIWVRARMAALSFILDTYSEPTVEGVRARLKWMNWHVNREIARDVLDDKRVLTALRIDFEVLMASGVHNGQAPSAPVRRTTAAKRADVLSILDACPELSDREIARRVGVSPQTVNNHRRARNGAAMAANGGLGL
ncbi:MAG: hypothetical protein B7X99_12135 [Rhizobiales bacterium 17-65-6]|nr:MAG: hypothetical protein B7X99_12135 [Rhizobiales bacterium 17-65-6]